MPVTPKAVVQDDVVFMYPPVGTQKVNAGRALFDAEPVYREAIMDCCAVSDSFLPLPLVDVLYPDESALELARSMIDQACFAQPCIFAVSFALTKLFESRGICPTAVLGHSIGEFAAATAAGVMDMPTGMTLVCERARLMTQSTTMGAMISVRATRATCEAAIQDAASADVAPTKFLNRISVASLNGPSATVISGDWFALNKVLAHLPREIKTQKVNASHPDHSPLNEAIHAAFRAKLQELFALSPPSAPAIAMVSTVTGVAAGDDIKSPEYWVRSTSSPVLFTDAFSALLDPGCKPETVGLAPTRGGHHHRLFVEVGTGLTLGMARSFGEERLKSLGIVLEPCLSRDTQGDDVAAFERCMQAVGKEISLARVSASMISRPHTLMHGWAIGQVLLEFVAKIVGPLTKKAMTTGELAQEAKLEQGPLAIALRTCIVLGYASFDIDSCKYSAVLGWELDELVSVLSPDNAASKALRSIYTMAVPPFQIPSEEASLCLQVWSQHRGAWRSLRSWVLGSMLDGIVLAPLVMTMTYYWRWNEQGHAIARKLDLSSLDVAHRDDFKDIIEEVLQIGKLTMNDWRVDISSEGFRALTDWRSHLTTAAFGPMLGQFPHILSTSAEWGFGENAAEEVCVQKDLAAVGSSVQIELHLDDLLRQIGAVFGSEDVGTQPKYVICENCGDGAVPLAVYQHVKRNTRRGTMLLKYPLTMVGIAVDEDSRVESSSCLNKANVPQLVLVGEVGKPEEIFQKLKSRKVDVTRALHVRMFADSAREYRPPVRTFSEDSAVAAFVRAHLPDSVFLDPLGKPILPGDAFASHLEHMERWGDSLDGSPGLCMFDTMSLDTQKTLMFFDDVPSLHVDMVGSLARHYALSAPAFALATAMAGLLPTSTKDVQCYPDKEKQCIKMGHHLVTRAYKIRLAELSDLPALESVEAAAWAEPLRAGPDVLKRRLVNSPTTNLVCVVGGHVVAALYTQRIADPQELDGAKYRNISDLHTPTGKFLQLITLAADPNKVTLGIGTELRAFALYLARLDATIESVVAVTLTHGFKDSGMSMQQYVDEHSKGTIFDPTLGFHTFFGGTIKRLVHDYRPEDIDNGGIGVLVQYNIGDMSTIGPGLLLPIKSEKQVKSQTQVVSDMQIKSQKPGVSDQPSAPDSPDSQAMVLKLMRDLGYEIDVQNLDRGFFDYGVTSAQTETIRERLSRATGADLPQTLVFDYPSVNELTNFLNETIGPPKSQKTTIPTSRTETPKRGLLSGMAGPDDEGPRGDIKLEDMIAMNREWSLEFARASWQKMFAKLGKNCYPNIFKYLREVFPYINDVQAKTLLKYGYIASLEPEIQHEGLVLLNESTFFHWKSSKKLQKLVKDVVRLTRQDPGWPQIDFGNPPITAEELFSRYETIEEAIDDLVPEHMRI